MVSNIKYSYLKHLDFLFWDVISLILSFLLAYKIRFGYFTINLRESWSTLLMIMVFVDIILTLVLRPYSGIFRRSYYQEIGRAFQLVIYNLAIIIIIFYVFKMGVIYSRLMLGTTYVLYFFLSNIIKYAWKKHVSGRKHDLVPLFVFSTREDCSSVIKDITSDDF
ncbi:MAG: hypothetical protein IKP86_11755, partial [Anaerolineaceae bacterium]|nr:hypothetical protein [Anaerolineaceae bacterium]